MTRSVDLVVAGVDLDDDATLEAVATKLVDLGWSEVDGRTIATVYTDSPDLVSDVIDAAHRIEHALPGARCVRVDENLVGVSDIAARTAVTREAVRMWTLGLRGPGAFPMPRGGIGSGANSMRVWAWADVVPWLSTHFGLCADESIMDPRDEAAINGHLQRVDHAIDAAWQRIDPFIVSTDIAVGELRGAIGATVRGAGSAGDARGTFGEFVVVPARQ